MDEFKEINTQETDNTDTNNTNEAAAKAAKRKCPIQRTIIISFGIVLLVLIAAVVCRLFFQNSVTDSSFFGKKASTCWHMTIPRLSTDDEAADADIYLIFEPDGSLSLKDGTVEYAGSYSYEYVTDEIVLPEGKPSKSDIGRIYLNISNTGVTVRNIGLFNNQLDGNYYFEEQGNAFSPKTLKLTSIYDSSYSITLDRKKSFTPVEIERKGEFNKDENLIGTWSSTLETYYGKQTVTYTFNDDGTYRVTVKNPNNSPSQVGIYNTKDGVFYLNAGDNNERPYRYEIKDDKLIQYVERFDQMLQKTVEDSITYTKQ